MEHSAPWRREQWWDITPAKGMCTQQMKGRHTCPSVILASVGNNGSETMVTEASAQACKLSTHPASLADIYCGS